MKNLTKGIATALVLVPFFGLAQVTDATTASGGFSESLFDRSTIQDIMSDPGCTAVRFYNVRPFADASNGTVLCIGVDQEGQEIRSGFSPSYRISEGLEGSTVRVKKMNRNKAAQACNHLVQAGYKSYSVEFSKEELSELLKADGCDGIRLTPEPFGDQDLTMTAESVGLDEGYPEPLGLRATSGDPCPVVCGEAMHYLNRTQR